jgi:hypothetical protein
MRLWMKNVRMAKKSIFSHLSLYLSSV